MPKMKSRRTLTKRFRFTGKGKVKHASPNKRHLLTGRSPKRRRQLRRGGLLASRSEQKTLKQLLPYGN